MKTTGSPVAAASEVAAAGQRRSVLVVAGRRDAVACASPARRVRFDPRPRAGVVRMYDADLPALLVNAAHRAPTVTPLLRRPRLLLLETVPAARQRGVVLEAAAYVAPTLSGTVVVRNDAYEKSVTLRYTLDGWQTVHAAAATWRETVPEAPDCDRFAFALPLDPAAGTFVEGALLQLCVCYVCGGHTSWDNNGTVNYAATLHLAVPDEVRAAAHATVDALPPTPSDSGSDDDDDDEDACEAGPATPAPVAIGGIHTVGSALWCRQIAEALQGPAQPTRAAAPQMPPPLALQTFWATTAAPDVANARITTAPYSWTPFDVSPPATPKQAAVPC
jgi:hypothetical protein